MPLTQKQNIEGFLDLEQYLLFIDVSLYLCQLILELELSSKSSL